MPEASTPTARESRARSRWPLGEFFGRVFDQWGDLLATRPTTKTKVSYREGGDAEKFSRTVDTGAADDAPSATSVGFDFVPFGDAAVYWKGDGEQGEATHTTITITPYVKADNGDWLLLDGEAKTIAASTEYVLSGVGFRTLYLRVTATDGGDSGTLLLLAAGI